MSEKKILWLPSWYPNQTAPFNGDFVKRHAEAASLYDEIEVIYVVRDIKGTVTKDVRIEEFKTDGLSEKIIYYYIKPFAIPLINKYFSEKKYRKLYKQAVEDFIKKSGKPDLVHVHVGMKAGSVALWLKKKYAVSYIISEHWSGFLPEAADKITDQPFYIQSLWKKIIAGSNAMSVVSGQLAGAIKKKYSLEKIEVIPNVVDTHIFYPSENNTRSNSFIHISGLEKLKNADKIISAFAIVTKNHPDARLEIFGPENLALKKLVERFRSH